MNKGTIIILVLLILIVLFVIFMMVKRKRDRKKACTHSCSGCMMSGNCPNRKRYRRR